MTETMTKETIASSTKSLRLVNVNNVAISGHLTRDPEIRSTDKGHKVAQFQLAVNRRYRDAAKEWKEEVSFFTVTAWNALAERCEKSARKGSPVYVEGRLRSEDWEDKGGEKRYGVKIESSQIQFLERSKTGKPVDDIPFGE